MGQAAEERSVPGRVLVVDDHRTFTDLLSMALETQDEFDFLGAAHGAADARAMIRELAPDVVVMDVRLGDDDGLALTREICTEHPEVRVVVLTAEPTRLMLKRAARAGACALLPKGGALADLLDTIRAASSSGLVVQPTLLRALMLEDPDETGTVRPPTSLTPQEARVLQMLGAGRDVRAISRELGISIHTCRGYVKSILHKLHAHSQLEAVALARAEGLIE